MTFKITVKNSKNIKTLCFYCVYLSIISIGVNAGFSGHSYNFEVRKIENSIDF